MRLIQEFGRGIYRDNPVFRLALGLCPTLAVTTSVKNGVGMGIAATAVLLCSNIIISVIKSTVPKKIRIPIFVVIIATFVTIADLTMHAFFVELHKNLGIFVPLIVVNCIILGRAEAFASRSGVIASAADGLGMGLGFTLALIVISAIRELVGAGTLWGVTVMPEIYKPAVVMVLPPGAFLTMGYLLALSNWYNTRMERSS